MADAGPPPGAHRGPFVGRDVELARLRDAFDGARAGAGGLVLVSGPAGIGKTRTVEEALDGVPVPVVWGRCVDDPGAPPLWPWRRVLRARPEVATAVGDALAAVDRDSGAADPDVARFRFVSAATEALIASAGPGGLVVVLEDLHWADPTSLRLLVHLAAELHRSHLLVLGSHRDPAGPHGAALRDALPELLRWPGTDLLELAPLAEDDVRRYLTAVASAPPEPSTVRGVHRRSGGNPLYLRALAAAGVGPDDAPASAALRSAVRTALAALPPDTVALLTVAAVLGEEVRPALLAAVADRTEDEVRRALDTAVHAGVLTTVPDSPGRRRFVHAVVRDGIYADLAPSDREALHRRVAEAWEADVGVDDTTAGVVAGHWLRASADPEALARAAAWARRASAAATRSLAFEEAAAFLRTALDASERAGCDGAQRAALLVEVAGTEYRAGRFAESLAHAVTASETADGPGRADLLVAAALAVHDVAAPGFPPAVIALCERALAEPDVTASPVLRARLLAQIASSHADAGRLGASSELSATALELAERAGDPEAILDAVRARMKVSVESLPSEERLRLGRLAIEHAGATGQPLVELWGAKWRIDAALETGDLATAEEELARVSALARRTGLPLVRWHDLRLRASIAALRGRFPEALALNEQARDLGARELAQDLSTAGMSGAFLLQHALITGDPGFWDDDARQLLDLAGDIPIVLVTRALVAHLRGDHDDARVRYEDLRRRLANPDFAASSGVPTNLVPLVEEYADPDTAEVLAGLIAARPIAAGGAGVYCCGSMSGLLGRLAVVRGRPDEAVAHFERALVTDTATGARPAVVHDRVGLAGALLRRGRPADLPRAAEEARAARREAAGLGMPGPAGTAAGLGDAVAAAVRAADPLTEREREIAGLVAAALTNRQIAERLVLSERTVETHVRHILLKLGAANRTEIAVLASPGT
ncbi:regulatory protein, luxR family [Blastococcus fimeti]|nr:regulatory protein, luxR family [Blastococcus fimeti]